MLAIFIAVSFSLTTITRFAAIFVEQYSFNTFPLRALYKLFLLAFLENFGYHQYITAARLPALFDVLRGKRGWARVKRAGL